MQLMGIPGRRSSISSALQESIGNGRSGEMPAFGARLDDTQIRLLLAWLTKRPAAQ
ncbi:MAG: hypothetical protein O2907_04850 [Proteobacteria bacterium]|nr:hypothetical protein [Pseudomonadota bacterium]MDA1063655.1 hypothetical protein [Pseudomonadota bacterium]